MAAGLALSACAGRDPAPIATVQPQDQFSDCTMIRAEIEANNQKAKDLADEQGLKVAQNVGAGLAARGYHRVLRVARTLADLDGLDEVGRVHLAEALSYRALADEVRRAA